MEIFSDLKFGVESLAAVQSGRVTTGQIVAHLLPLNSPPDINRALSTVLGSDFFALMKKEKYAPPGDLSFQYKTSLTA